MKRYNSTPEAIARLHAAVDKLRKGSETVRVQRTDLVNLLMDHAQVAGYLLDLGIIVQDPVAYDPEDTGLRGIPDKAVRDYCEGAPPRSVSAFIAECDRRDRERDIAERHKNAVTVHDVRVIEDEDRLL